MKFTSKKQNLIVLNKIVNKGKISSNLHEVVESLIDSVKNNNVTLVSELASVKSLISGNLKEKCKKYPFNEDSNFNEKVLGSDVYCLLDHINFEFSVKSDRLPSGMTVLHGNTMTEQSHTDNSNHSVVKKINKEFDDSRKRCEREIKEENKKK